MISEIHDALKSAGADDEKARRAAQAVAEHDENVAELKSGLRLLQWMVGFNLAFTVAVLWKVIGA